MLAYFKWLISYIIPYKVLALILILFLLIEAGFNSSLRFSLKFLIEAAQNPADGTFFLICWIFGGATLAYLLISFIGDWLWAKFGILVINNIRRKLFNHILILSLDFFARRQTGDVLNCFVADLTLLEESLVSTISCGLLSLADFLFSISLISYLNSDLALLVLSGLSVIFIITFWLISKASESSYILREKEGILGSNIQEKLLNFSVIKLFSLEKNMSEDFSLQLKNIMKISVSAQYLRFLIFRLPKLLFILLQVITITLSGIWILEGKLEISVFVAFQVLFIGLLGNIETLSWVLPYLVNETAVMERLNSVLSEVPSIVEQPQAIVLPTFSKAIDFKNVTFGYFEDQKILEQVSLSFRRGQFTTIVGESGSGKSTIIKLLLRFYDPHQGCILFDGIDLRNVTQDSLRAQIGVVSQNVMLFNTTIAQNIRFGHLNATDEEIRLAAKDAEIDDYIMSLPQKYDTIIGEKGSQLSGGQGQRIALARALVRNPAILILDEATSALDPITEASILHRVSARKIAS